MKYFFLIISNLLAVSCSHSVATFPDLSATDSITVYYERMAFEAFAAVSAKEFAGRHRQMPSVVIRDSATMRKLVARIDSLRVASDPEGRLYMDTHMMLVLHRRHWMNDTLFLGFFPQQHLQLNRHIMEPDSVLWTEVHYHRIITKESYDE